MSLITDIVAYWKLDDDTTDSAASYDLTGNGSIAYDTGIINNSFDNGSAGGNNYFTLDDHMGISATGAMTIAGWTKFNTAISDANSPDWSVIKRYVNANGSGFGWIHEWNSGTPRLRVIRFGETNYIGDYAYTPSVGTWFHVVITYDGTNIITYLNGTKILGPTSNTGTQNITGLKFVLGSYSGSSATKKYWALDEYGVWSRALTQAEVTALYNSGDGLAYPFSAGTTFIPTITIF